MASEWQQSRQAETEARRYGKYAAVVLDNEPLEGKSAHYGDLVVQVPGILEEKPDGSGERPLQGVARPCFPPGTFFVPEVGARVWVEFVAGNVNELVWVGVWYPSRAEAETTGVPLNVDGESPSRYQKVIRTVSGHVIHLEDLADDSTSVRLVIRDETNNRTMTLDHEGIKLETSDDDKISEALITSSKVRLSVEGGESTLEMTKDSITLARGASTIEITDGGIKLTSAAVDVES
jgi:hypothetical protein